jgi:pimeloyl-ACP methyl ester carboxylesterase
MKSVVANGLRFAYLEDGEGPLVLLMHGFPDTAHTWDDVAPRVAAAGFRTVRPFMRGYAPSEIPARDTDMETLARDVLALIPALGAERAIVVGHDWGGVATYGAATLEPARVTKLFTVGIPHPASLRVTPLAAWRARHFFAYKLPGAARRFAANDFAALPAIYRRWSPMFQPGPEEFAAVRAAFADPKSLGAALGYYRSLPLRPPPFLRVPIPVPAVAFAGLDDPNLTPADYERARRYFTAGYDIETVRGGHFMHREDREAFATKLLARLKP